MNLLHLNFFKQLNMPKLPPLVFQDIREAVYWFHIIHVKPPTNKDPTVTFRYANQTPVCIDLFFDDDQTISIYAVHETGYQNLHPATKHQHPLSKQLAIQTNWKDSQAAIFNYIQANY